MRAASVGQERPVQGVEEIPVHLGRRADQPPGVDQVSGTLLVDVDGGVRERAGHVADAAGVVEVDVGDRDGRQVSGGHTEAVEGAEERVDRRAAPGLDQRRLVTVHEVAGGDPLPPTEQRVDLGDAGADHRVHRGRVCHASLVASRTVEDRLFDPTPTLTVAELAQRIGTVIDRAFEDEVWLRGEIQSLNPNRSRERRPVLRSGRAGGRRRPSHRPGRRRAPGGEPPGDQRPAQEQPGLPHGGRLDVRIRGHLEFWRRSGQLRFRMTAIDPDYTLGRLANERERVLTTLRAEGLVDRNAGLPLAEVPLRVALVTSIPAACADFLHELEASGFGWSVHVIDTRVQGIDAAVARGGPSSGGHAGTGRRGARSGRRARTDLAVLDGEAIAREIAALAIPVLTGIGHEVDRSVADEVAHTSLKTPTACAAHLVARCGRSASDSIGLGRTPLEQA